MDLKDKTTGLMMVIAVLWIFITALGWTGHWLIGMYLSLILMFIHMILGSAKKGIVDKKFVFYPLFIWLVLWAVSFHLSNYYGLIFKGTMPTFTILGFHPSFAWTIFTYWIGGVLTLSIGYYLYKDLWLSDKEWSQFLSEIERLNKEKGGRLK